MSKKLRRYHATREVIDSKNQKHTILVYGELLQTNDDKGFILAPITYKKKDRNNIVSFDDKYVVLSRHNDLRPTREFNFGWAICDPNDEFDMATGVKLAKKRFSDSPMTTTDVRFFSDDMIAAILKNELNFIQEHLEDKYLPDDYKNGCNGECETCQRHDCESKGSIGPEVKTYDESKELEHTEEFPSIKLECDTTNAYENFKHGDFIKFNHNGYTKYGIVRSLNNGVINMYWEFTCFNRNNYAFETNTAHEVENISINEYSKSDNLHYCKPYLFANNKLEEVFGYRWDSRTSRLIHVIK